MNVFRLLGRSVMRSFALTSIFSLSLILGQYAMSPDTTPNIFSQFFLILFYGFVCGFAYEIIKLRILPLAGRIAIHYGIVFISFMILCLVTEKLAFSIVPISVYFFVFTSVYAAVMALILLLLKVTGIYNTDMAYKSAPTVNRKQQYNKRFGK